MTRYLLILLLLIAALKFIGGSSIPAGVLTVSAICAPDGAGADEQEGEGQDSGSSQPDHSKFDDDDKIHSWPPRHTALISSAGALRPALPPGQECSGHAGKPFTPPDGL